MTGPKHILLELEEPLRQYRMRTSGVEGADTYLEEILPHIFQSVESRFEAPEMVSYLSSQIEETFILNDQADEGEVFSLACHDIARAAYDKILLLRGYMLDGTFPYAFAGFHNPSTLLLIHLRELMPYHVEEGCIVRD